MRRKNFKSGPATRAFYKSIRYWKTILGLTTWKINIEILDGDLPERHPTQDRVGNAVADCSCDWRYLHGTIRVNGPELEEQGSEEAEEIALHELIHCVVSQAEIQNHDREERLVSELTSNFLWLRNDRVRANGNVRKKKK